MKKVVKIVIRCFMLTIAIVMVITITCCIVKPVETSCLRKETMKLDIDKYVEDQNKTQEIIEEIIE